MKKLFTLCLFFSLAITAQIEAACGMFQSYIIYSSNGNPNTYRAGGLNPDMSTTWNGQDLGNYNPNNGDELTLKGGEVKTFKNGGSNITGAKLFYAVFLGTGAYSGPFTEVNLPYDSELGGDDQKWTVTNLTNDLLAGLTTAGTYTIQVYWQATGTSPSPEFDSNSPNDFRATFFLDAVLPIELASLKAHNTNNNVSLDWVTKCEKGSDRFDIERSANGKDWAKLGSLKAKGYCSTASEYNFMDNAPTNGINYYRLKMLDGDGKYSFSNVVNATIQNTKISLTLSPNPAFDRVNLNISQNGKYNLFDVSGKNIESGTLQGTQLPINHLQSGVYFLKVNNETLRFVKQ